MKKNIFVSHISEEEFVATSILEILKERFKDKINFFSSTHKGCIELGDKWLENIKESMETADLILLICSPISITRHWINFEAGAGWIRGIPVIPLCHSGLKPGQLPSPISFYQGAEINSTECFEKLCMRISKLCGTNLPNLEAEDFLTKITEFEKKIKNELLYKDTLFIKTLLFGDLKFLKYCIYASTMSVPEIIEFEKEKLRINNYTINYNKLFNLFNPSMLNVISGEKVYVQYYKTIISLSNNIKFILSRNNMSIAPDILKGLENFIFLGNNIDWYSSIDNICRNMKQFDFVYSMIKDEPTPLRKANGTSLPFFKYYFSLEASKQLLNILSYEFDSILGNDETIL
ncbi:MAG: toll/interleukin-1 receptor domain-containing protein [Saprospiraceae bacterium]|uniref:Toll/interleukin-1 receptor domain-containing protein n=1 Tax=Candidatus Defluviibacterium haderslevense TaxID=2981993 RepID=A0A9D7S971_9BACT|nr:toll/interleukin-1 receptor domain-containing protein [Candidatus Defluviibacterium haderslevense]MBK9717689.1 toll/interleukin-1 receptor domain-containing protein [Candidatus Defluviibacterium haderslevense]